MERVLDEDKGEDRAEDEGAWVAIAPPDRADLVSARNVAPRLLTPSGNLASR